MVTNTSSAESKIALFRSLFRGREDVYPVRFENRKTGRSGYAPACGNEWVRVKGVPQGQQLRPGSSLWSGRQLIGVEPTRVALEDNYLLAYSWPGLDRQRRQLLRALLREARVQLRNIPAGSLGMICIQTVSSKRFLPDIHELIDQEQFSRIPIIWLNPSLLPGMESKVVFRDGARNLVDRLLPGT